MILKNCPHCGGKLRSESRGWICYNCKGFIDMQGNFHEHIERPFMPPMTNADRIRAMSDEELADFISNCGCPDHARNCRASCKDCVTEWLKQPAEVE